MLRVQENYKRQNETSLWTSKKKKKNNIRRQLINRCFLITLPQTRISVRGLRRFRILSWGYKRILSDKMRQVFGHPKKQKRLMIKMDVQCSLSVSKYLRLPCSKACKFSYLLLCTYSIFTQIESWANFCGFPGNPPFLGPPSSRWYLHKAVDFVVLCRKTVPMIIRHE